MTTVTEKKSVFRTEEGRRIVREAYEGILEAWPVPCKRRYAGDTHLIECGDENADPLFLLHGTMSNSAAWMGDVAEWSSSFRVFAVDLPGEPGLSSEERVSPSGDGFSDWLEGLLDSLGYRDMPVSIVGQSLGSFVALKFMVKHPERVKKISMLTTSGAAPARMSFMLKAIPLMLLGRWGAGRIDRMIAYGVDIDPAAAAYGALVSKHCRPLMDPIPVFTDAELARLTMPLQFFGGDHDVLLNTEATIGRLRRFVPRAEINLLEETGHVIIGKTGEILRFMTAG